MDDLQAGHYWKRPFLWEPGCPEPATTSRLKFEEVADGWLASAAELLAEMVRICRNANCWRIFCDTGTDNHPMVQAFRRAGFKEGLRWQRSIAHVRIA